MRVSKKGTLICGGGIQLDKQRLVFERFHKIVIFTQYSGLGLSVTLAIAIKLNGKLTINSE